MGEVARAGSTSQQIQNDKDFIFADDASVDICRHLKSQIVRWLQGAEDRKVECNKVQETTNYVDFWTDPVPGRRTDMMVPNDLMQTIDQFLTENGIKYHAMVEDVQSLIDEVDKSRGKAKTKMMKDYQLDWDDYYGIDVLNEFID